MVIDELNQKFSTNKTVRFSEKVSGFPVLEVSNPMAHASISLYGAQLLSFQPLTQDKPVIWMSDRAIFKEGKAIRGGVPVCWPWFGEHEKNNELPAHGFARTSLWEVKSIKSLAHDETQIELQMPCGQQCVEYQHQSSGFQFILSLRITVGNSLTLELKTTNTGSQLISLTEALHTYFNISTIDKISVLGLESVNFLDKLQSMKSYEQVGEITLSQETDRVYQHTASTIVLLDEGFNRKITISKKGSQSTVIWNPWREKSLAMSDMPDPCLNHSDSSRIFCDFFLYTSLSSPLQKLQIYLQLSEGDTSPYGCVFHPPFHKEMTISIYQEDFQVIQVE